MTLRDAIIKVLKDSGRPMTTTDIAEVINKSQLYFRKDKNSVPGSQIRGLVKKYPQFFNEYNDVVILNYNVYSGENEENQETYLKNIFQFYNNTLESIKWETSNLQKKINEHNYELMFLNNKMKRNNNNNELTDHLNVKSIKDKEIFEIESNISKLESDYNEISKSRDRLKYYPLTNIMAEFGISKNSKIQFITLIFFYRILALIKENHISNYYIDKETIQTCKNIDNRNPSDIKKAIINLNKYDYFKEIFTPFIDSIENQFTFKHDYVLKSLGEFDFSIKSSDINDFGLFFSELFKSLLVEENKLGYENYSPQSLARFIAGIVVNEIKEDDVIYDPVVGSGKFFIEIFNSIEKNNFNNLRFIGQEINKEIAAVCRMNLIMNGIYNTEIITSNSLIEPAVKSSSVDISISDPPFSNRIIDKEYTSKLDYLKIKSSDSVNLFIQFIISRLKSNGIMTIVVPKSFLYSSKNENIRKALVKGDLIDCIINMPFSLASSLISVIVIKQTKALFSRNRIAFVDFQNNYKLESENDKNTDKFFEIAKSIVRSQKEENNYTTKELTYDNLMAQRIVIDSDQIERNGFDLNSSVYTNPVLLAINESLSENEKLYRLKDLVLESNFKTVISNANHEYGSLPFIRIKNLSDSLISKLNYEDSILFKETKEKGKLIDISAVLVGSHGISLKPTWFEYSDKPIIVSSNIIPLAVDKNKIIPEYLAYQLRSEIVISQIERVRRGETIPFIRRSDLLAIKIPVPTISEQINRLAEYHKQLKQKSTLTNFINSIKLIKDPEGIKNEIESFAKGYFPGSEHIIYRTEIQFDKFPFSSEDIANGRFIVSSHDKLIQHMLIINQDNDVYGVVTISEEKPIDPETYSEINAYGNFLFKIYDFVNKSAIDENYERFAHTSKSFFSGIQAELDSVISSPNKSLIDALKNNYTDTEENMLVSIEDEGLSKDDYIAFNKLQRISTKISGISNFYLKTDSVLKNILQGDIEEFSIQEILNEIMECEDYILVNKSINYKIKAKRGAIKQALLDIIQNARNYSPDKKCEVTINSKGKVIEIIIENKVAKPIPEEKYKNLGIEILTISGRNPSCGLYWAFRAVHDIHGKIEIANYKEHREKLIFKIVISLKQY